MGRGGMTAILSMFSCCLQRKPAGQNPLDGPNESSHLIPATVDPTPSSPSAYIVDHQRVNERMHNVVRSKEGKMVNVASRLPFNLRNKKMSVALDLSTSSSSRSASTSTSALGHIRAPLTTTGVRGGDLSRSSSLGSRETSAYESERFPQTPILNVRLVRGIPAVDMSASRGRPERKAFDAEGHRGTHSGEEEEEQATPRVHDLPSPVPIPGVNAPTSARPTLYVSPASTVGFKLQDAGPLTVSWGD